MSVRTEKVAEEIKHKLNTAMSKDLMELNMGLVTISKVIMTPDLKIAKVYITILGNKEPVEKCLERINLRKKNIRYTLAKHIALKYTPELFFYYDDTAEYADRINKLLHDLHIEKEGGKDENAGEEKE
jgi:ribosome-binding factor A